MNETIKRRKPQVELEGLSQNDDYDKFDKNEFFISRRKHVAATKNEGNSIFSDIMPTKEELKPHITPLIYTFISALTRLIWINYEPSVVWDEAHFGKFGSYYLKRTFYFDVHPPLGKMLVGLAGALSGYNGNFEFKSGEPYPNDLHYGIFRGYLAIFGVLIVPLAWYTSEELRLSKRSCHLVTLMVLFDTALATISRFILLDSMLLFFTFTTVFFLTKFHNERHECSQFGFDWWMWLVFTGLSIGCVCSVKWVGLFVTAVVGIYTITDLWDKFGDLKLPKQTYAYHWVARIGCLILIPIIVYVASFKAHFAILNRSGSGDSQMSSLFQANLKGNKFYKSPLEVAYGSKITLKQMGYAGGLLHSHVQNFPLGSLEGQVTCYHYQDDNNQFNVLPTLQEEKANELKVLNEGDNADNVTFLHDGDVIRLEHVPYSRYIHAHDIPAPLSKLDYEVAAFGQSTEDDTNDNWIVEVVDDVYRGRLSKEDKIHSLTTRLRFKNKNLGCYLRAANKNLPEWGFKQIEVTCTKENDPRDDHTYWNVESHWNDKLPAGKKSLYKTSFLKDFWHLNIAMMMSNNALIPNPDKQDILASKPTDWPFLRLGLRMNGWGDHNTKYYLIGNPVVWWTSSLALFVFVAISLYHTIRERRRVRDVTKNEIDYFTYVGMIAFGGWVFHYIPFLIMGRVTYLHHYLPALYFAILVMGLVLDHLIFKRQIPEKFKWFVFGLLAVNTIVTFYHFNGVVFGMVGPISKHKHLKWRNSWNIYN
ncbi:glycosyltransferase family 39 protein [Wallemia mellicola]|uniref:Dolichyl-phosphate-mannose--protein mannosyltransferase n=1 Tax=Wallemia mellicola TaxID=1708541 RepID=A0A4T0PII1_9BASI|nr:glycosyltransferase family 39 protein [Wallemia mellicola]TIC10254.1 glycosyltransferase family 39 protein [Wallemia mellicola]TIC25814.1 glycosyltransferase family 39 protein [Wallemia mellicola]TIC28039.1 glycosyltransferase family 39 protein [Wallemia mellicola]TIC48829.1 glycosyltransferase family 39 protein [Wallemia mellicola]